MSFNTNDASIECIVLSDIQTIGTNFFKYFVG